MASEVVPLAMIPQHTLDWVVSQGVEWASTGLQLRNGTEIGISRRGLWVVGDREVAKELEGNNGIVGFLGCLEIPIRDFERELTEALCRSGFSRDASRLFPWIPLIEAGIRSGSQYWAELAMDWAARRPGQSISIEALRELAKAKWATQQLRQRARRLAKGARDEQDAADR